ncbi:MAG: adenylate/guanylate cyclase domain-containing protein [Dehalococcoidia bacterium]
MPRTSPRLSEPGSRQTRHQPGPVGPPGGYHVDHASGYATCGRIGFGQRYEYTAIGTVPNLAARLCGVAAAGAVLVSERVFRIVESSVTAEPVGSFDLKGLSRPVNAFRLESLAAR